MDGVQPEGYSWVGFGPTTQNIIDYITISTGGNATNFGDLTLHSGHGAGVHQMQLVVFWWIGDTPWWVYNA